MSTASVAVVPDENRPWSPGARLGAVGAVALAALALVETAQAIVAPLRAPVTRDWKAAGDQIRVAFQAGDLIVAAPAWADPVMRTQVGDLVPIPAAARMDDARFARVWVISQRGASAPEAAGRTLAFTVRFGALTLQRFDGRAAEVTFDFLERWRDAYVTHWNPATRVSTPCPWQADRFTCPVTGNSVRQTLVEVDQKIRRALLAPPVLGGIVAAEFASVTLGRELVVGVGLHDTWARKSPGTAYLEIWISGRSVGGVVVDNRGGWRLIHLDTSARAGQRATVRFQVSSPRPELRHLAFAAEARR